MKFIKFSCILMLLFFSMIFALEPAKVNLEPLPMLRGDEILLSNGIPYLGGRQSPGDQIGTTWYDFQAHCGGSSGQRLFVDAYNQAHINWMKMDASGYFRCCAWNFRFANGSYYGEVPASESWSGYVQLDVTRDGTERTVITYHYHDGSIFCSWIDIDAGNGWGLLPNDPKSLGVSDHYEANIAVTSNNYIVLACHTVGGPYRHHLYLTTDLGDSWTHLMEFDSVATASHFVRASRNSGSHKVIFAHTQFITDTIAGGQLDNDIWYTISTDDGVNWGDPVNITNYQPYPIDSVRANDDLSAIFDLNDNLHIVWTGIKVTDNYYAMSKIFHWDEVNDTITIVSSDNPLFSGGWWGWKDTSSYGSSRRPADQPQLIIDPTDGWLYCLWHGNTDTTDISATGWPNGELYGAYSTDNGITWSSWINLTNTPSPGAAPGACYDDDYMTANPYVVSDSIYITYIEDKDAGAGIANHGEMTENPVRCWVFNKNLITGIVESTSESTSAMVLELFPNPASRFSTIFYTIPESNNISLKLYSIDGRLVQVLDTGYKMTGTYKFILDLRNLANGTYFLILDTMSERITNSIIIVH